MFELFFFINCSRVRLLLKMFIQSNISKRASSLETALQLVQRAVTEDKQRNYNEALTLYQHALVYFLESINCKRDFQFRCVNEFR